MTAAIVRIVRKLPSSPNTSGRATPTKKARAACVKSITLNKRRWKFQSDIWTFRAAIVFCLKERMGRSRINRVKVPVTYIKTTLENKSRYPSVSGREQEAITGPTPFSVKPALKYKKYGCFISQIICARRKIELQYKDTSEIPGVDPK
ncbi:hypothetical protein AVEN_260796-1 [Araneus ventricosus]|uniref:Uncharacterized protein n=1 Tax=Araneus ventricosus TaxID=182803 RepID=A0A4Y2FDP0_ARAVE|nr:hypothetical protein AVEN_260796-1 [Araneus ventricosus]